MKAKNYLKALFSVVALLLLSVMPNDVHAQDTACGQCIENASEQEARCLDNARIYFFLERQRCYETYCPTGHLTYGSEPCNDYYLDFCLDTNEERWSQSIDGCRYWLDHALDVCFTYYPDCLPMPNEEVYF